AGAVRADQAEHGVALELEAQAVDRDQAAEALGHVAHRQQRRRHRAPPGKYRRSGRGSSPWGRNSSIRITRIANSQKRYSWIACSFSGTITRMAVATTSPQGLPMPPSSTIDTMISDASKVKLVGAMKPIIIA